MKELSHFCLIKKLGELWKVLYNPLTIIYFFSLRFRKYGGIMDEFIIDTSDIIVKGDYKLYND